MLTTLKVVSNTDIWVNYQLASGLGSGTDLQQPVLAVKNVLELEDIPIGVAISMFLSLFSETLFAFVS